MFNFLTERFSSIFSAITGSNKLSEKNMADALDQVKDALLEADVPHHVAKIFCEDIRTHAIGTKVLFSLKPSDQLVKVVHDRLKFFLGGDSASHLLMHIPLTVMVMGLQGSGKTTSLAKIAHRLKKEWGKKGKRRKILLASVDFYRPAAIEQLKILAKQIDVSFYASPEKDVIKAVHDICQYRKKGCYDILLLDTAGRLHIDQDMLKELQKIQSYLKPNHNIMVLDSMTGQESLNVAQSFEKEVGFDCAMMTKMDSNASGGAALAFRYVIKKPIIFVGTGEKTEDLEVFHPDRMAGRILGMGDVISLAERAEERIDKTQQESSYKALQSGRLTMQDFANQMSMMNKLGSFSQILKYMPGMGGQKISQDMLDRGESEMKKFRAIISSMTPKERSGGIIVDTSRKKRVARGAGVQPNDVNLLLQRFQQAQQYVKLFKKFGRFNNSFK